MPCEATIWMWPDDALGPGRYPVDLSTAATMTINRHPTPASPRSVPATIVLLIAFVVAGCGTIVSVDAEDVRDTPSPSSAVAVDGSVAVSPAAASPSAAVTGPSPSAARTTPVPAHPPVATPEPPRTRFAMDLYRKGDYVAQYTFEWCVGASLQMALNMTTAVNDTTRVRQEQLWEMAQARSTSPFGGANPRGWTAALNDLGIGPYVLVSLPDLDRALQVAARALRETKRPVGLVMWRGRHAWVMSGFEFERRSGPRPGSPDHRRPCARPAVPARQQGLGSLPEARRADHPSDAGKAVRDPRPRPDEPGRAAGLSPRPADSSRGRRPGCLTAIAVAQVSSRSRPVDTSKMRPWTGTGVIQGCARSRATDERTLASRSSNEPNARSRR